MLRALIREQRDNAVERLLRADEHDLSARRAAVLTLDAFTETLNERIKRAVGDDSAP